MDYPGKIKERECRDDDSIKTTRGERFIKIWDFMVWDFNLEKSELFIYAIIFAMHRNYCDYFKGSREYLAKWSNTSTRTVAEALKSLEKKNLIKKYYVQYQSIKRAVYHINTEALPDCEMFSLENCNRDNNKKIREFERRKALGLN